MSDFGAYILWSKQAEHEEKIDDLQRRVYDKTLSDLEKITNLEWRVENLVLLNQAMWLVLKEKLGLDERDLLRKFEELDLADGKADGRMGQGKPQAPWTCTKCQKENSPRFSRCVRCDTPVPRLGVSGAFEKIT